MTVNVAPRPANDAERVVALHGYAVLDTAPEPALDEIAALAANVCGTPIALISLVDDQRVWFKARVGFDGAELPRDVALDAHAILRPDALLIVEDAQTDPRFADNPLVTGDAAIRFYAGAPLVTPAGHVLGTLCVIDHQPRKLNAVQRQTLGVLSRSVMTHMALQRSAAAERPCSVAQQVDGAESYRAVVEAAPCGIVVVDQAGIITLINDHTEALFGWSRAELVGQAVEVLLPESLRAGQAIERDRFFAHPETRPMGVGRELLGRRKDGSEFPLEIGLNLVTTAEGPRVLATVVDNSWRQQAEDEVRRLAEIVASSNDAIIGKTLDSVVTSWNAAAERLFGYSEAEMIGTPITRLIPTERLDEERHILESIQRGERIRDFDTVRINKAGQHIDVSVTISPITDHAGRIIGASKIVRDIGERKRAEQALSIQSERMALATKSHGIGVWDWDLSRNTVLWDARMFEIYGLPEVPDGVLDYRDWANAVLPEDLPAQEAQLQETVRRCGRGERKFRIRRRIDGALRVIQASEMVLTDTSGEGVRVVGINYDVTEREEANDRLVALNDELRAATVRAQTADRLKSAFLATMSHELRTPLNSIIGFTGVVLQELPGPLNAEQKKQLEMVRTSSRHLLSLINDVLDLSKIEAGEMQLSAEPVDLCAAVDASVAIVRPLAESKGLTLRAELAPAVGPVVGDPQRVKQILMNLLSNAIKFTRHGSITVSVLTTASGPGVQVADTGMGIKAEDMVELFKPFTQIETGLSRNHDGTGLGLVICRKFAALMGGEVHAESVWEKGSVFTLVLPPVGPAAPAA
ncbi:MAG TPA: PAS domain S-box protein [Denitromonas sp.]|uniref:PAS domain S-box protein n=1 Tax=Denitromonas sp. TaxID=2734609 RepID=UPI001D24EB08|nr:PAS domain S-box protein [Rhodocyclaceae bacterium]MCP5223006.1 PAS domain S-box protein [Zoogloeaceae bacterium]HPR05723.1 PAS domain S-box protein [Denitromonas sp.]HQU87540.1 PAS domain S-box protein [Denitromonas sp.]HQV13786.1 PAS domain S-box protein [Denitromonas sp.]